MTSSNTVRKLCPPRSLQKTSFAVPVFIPKMPISCTNVYLSFYWDIHFYSSLLASEDNCTFGSFYLCLISVFLLLCYFSSYSATAFCNSLFWLTLFTQCVGGFFDLHLLPGQLAVKAPFQSFILTVAWPNYGLASLEVLHLQLYPWPTSHLN